MAFDLEKIMTSLVKNRIIVLGILGSILILSFGIGYIYQQKLDKEKEARVLFDEAWQKVYAVISDLQSQPNGIYTPGHQNIPQVKKLYTEALEEIDLLVTDFDNTVSGARAALLVKMVTPLTNINSLLDDSTLIAKFNTEDYLENIKKKHNEFWGAAISVVEGMEAEQKFDFSTALNYYQDSLKLDKKKYLRDYIIIAIARNYEMLDNKEQAIEYYQKIENEYPNSVWLSFAMGKIYILSQNLANTEITKNTNL